MRTHPFNFCSRFGPPHVPVLELVPDIVVCSVVLYPARDEAITLLLLSGSIYLTLLYSYCYFTHVPVPVPVLDLVICSYIYLVHGKNCYVIMNKLFPHALCIFSLL